MTRRRIFWLISAFVVLLGAAAIAWAVFGNQDADFQAIGPRTKGVRANFAKLDMTVDAADFHDCKTLGKVLDRLEEKFGEREDGKIPHWRWLAWGRFVECRTLAKREAKVEYPEGANPMALKDFLRMTFRQVSDQETVFIVGRYGIGATTIANLNKERARYNESVPLFERVKTAFNELMGHVEDDPPATVR